MKQTLPHPAFGHLLPLEETGEGHNICLLPPFAREKVAEGRMRDNAHGAQPC
jgi:hypothetical protein